MLTTSTADTPRDTNISECESPWTFRSYPNYAFVSEHTALKKTCFVGYLRALLFQTALFLWLLLQNLLF